MAFEKFFLVFFRQIIELFAVGLSFEGEKILRFLAGTALWSLGSASTAFQKYTILRLLINFDMLYCLAGVCYRSRKFLNDHMLF
jgi:hypothetical protein